MKYYLVSFILYLVVAPMANYLFNNAFLAYTLSILVVSTSLILFLKQCKLEFKFDSRGVITGVVILAV